MTDDQIRELERLLGEATAGPWEFTWDDLTDDDVRVCYTRDGKRCEWCVALAGETLDGVQWTPETLARWKADAHLIAAARNALPDLLAERRKLMAVVEAARRIDTGGYSRQAEARLAAALRDLDEIDDGVEAAHVTEHDVAMRQPETMSVRQLNLVVRALREKLHQERASADSDAEDVARLLEQCRERWPGKDGWEITLVCGHDGYAVTKWRPQDLGATIRRGPNPATALRALLEADDA